MTEWSENLNVGDDLQCKCQQATVPSLLHANTAAPCLNSARPLLLDSRRQRKVRCNRENPCNNCLRSKNANCVYRDGPASSSKPSQSQNLASPPPPNNNSEVSNLIATNIELTLRHEKPSTLVASPSLTPTGTSVHTPTSHLETTSVGIAGTFHFQNENQQPGKLQTVSRSVSHKTRLFGQSHWMNGVSLLRDMFDVVEPHMRDESSKTFNGLRRCKQLAKAIKQHRAPPWPCLPTAELPPKAVSDQLVDCYLRTIEPIYRILHIPSFRRDYETLWSSPSSTPDTPFLVQVKLVLAIGATTYDSTFSLKGQAIRWVYEAQTWLSAPEFKHHLGIQSIQSTCLLLFAREATGVGEDLIWVSLGSLVRTAMYVGLHRDSTGLPPNMTLLAKEMRRRLWTTILELVVHHSMISGGPPLIGLDDFDTEVPGNLDDGQLTTDEPPSSVDESTFTDTTVAIALRKTFPQRLAIAKFLNDITSKGTYQDTLRLDAELRAAYRSLVRSMHGIKSSLSTQKKGPSEFELRSLDLIMRRYSLSLHLPFFGAALHETSFAFSRKVAVESALRFWRAAFPNPLTSSGEMQDDDLLARQVNCSSGVFHMAGIQAFIVIASELKAILKEEDRLGPVSLRPDLLAVLEDAKIWGWNGIRAGETNIKGYLFVQMVCAQVKALTEGREDDLAQMVVSATEESEERCLAFFEEVVSGLQGTAEGNPSDGMDFLNDTPEFVLGDWDHVVPQTYFEPVFVEPLNWSLW